MSNSDIEYILSTKYDNGADYWATPDGKLGVGGPFSTLSALLILSDLGLDCNHEAVKGGANLLIDAIRDDGKIKISKKGSVYPCHMASAATALCRNGYGGNPKVNLMLGYLLNNQHTDGGWRCNKFLYGRGPETEFSNPGVTLAVLDAFRCIGRNNKIEKLDYGVESLLHHWTIKEPIGPCHYGIGTQFMKVECPLLRYNIFYFAYVLSFYNKAKDDPRFLQVLDLLNSKLNDEGMVIIERPHLKLSKLESFKKGQPSVLATKKYLEILSNLESTI